MNNDRRKRITDARAVLEDLQARIEEIRDEEREAADNMEEHFPGSERAEIAASAADSLDEAYDGVGDVLMALENAECAG